MMPRYEIIIAHFWFKIHFRIIFSITNPRELGNKIHTGHFPDIQTRAQGRRRAKG